MALWVRSGTGIPVLCDHVWVGGGQGEGAAVEDVLAALADEELVQRAERASFAGQDEDVGGGAFTDPVSGRKAGVLCEVAGCVRVSRPPPRTARLPHPETASVGSGPMLGLVPFQPGTVPPNVNDAKEPPVISPYVRRLRLAMEIRTRREAANLTSEELGKRIAQSRMKISRLETGARRPDIGDVMKILDVLNVSGDEWRTLVQVARDAAERGWWETAEFAGMGERQKLYADLECGAASIREYQIFIPGLLQTRDYTRARRPIRDNSPQFDLERAVEARQRRQQELHQEGGPTYEAVLDEVAVRRIAADPSIMEAQLQRLLELTNAVQRIAMRVLPLGAVVHEYRLPYSPFSIYTYPDADDPVVVVVDTVTTDLVLTEPEEVGPYVELYDAIQAAALSPGESLDYLASSMKRLPREKR
jgi:transcriptional regulator with XRE-family HTH domain